MRGTPLERFVAKFVVDKKTGCWLWTAYTRKDGYGVFGVTSGDTWLAHRWAYEQWVGPIPKGLTIDHLCRVRNCVNPDHMEPVPPGVNTLRGDTFQARNAAKTHCPKGHEYYVVNDRGWRRCRTCGNEQSNARRKKWRDENPEEARRISRESVQRWRDRHRKTA
jgi:hypothetical protein